MAVNTYAPDRVIVTFGANKLAGFADGAFIEIEEVGEGVQDVSGADGEVARAMSADRRIQVTVTLLQTSDSNTVLSAYNEADRVSHGGGSMPLLITDLKGATVVALADAWVQKKPNSSFDKTVGSRAWIIRGKGSYKVGGAV